jgi:hypothetical protein
MNQIAEHFWNFRGVFRLGGIFDIGTQMSLVRRISGSFLLIDSYALEGVDREKLLAVTDNGKAIDAIINVHPFHTRYCRAAHQLAPTARMIGTRRHQEFAPELPWEKGVIEDIATQAEFADDLDFSVPEGVDFVCSNESVHVASALVRHRASGIVHVDDTLNVLSAPGLLGRLFPQSRLRFHPMLSKALSARPGAADDYDRWARDLAVRWADTHIVCAAHSAMRRLPAGGWEEEMLHALSGVEKILSRHRARHG